MMKTVPPPFGFDDADDGRPNVGVFNSERSDAIPNVVVSQ